jgi:hypothetical protein
MHGSPTEFSHTSHSALTCPGLWMYHQQDSATHHIQHLYWIMHGSPKIQPHFTFSTYTGLCMDHQQNSATHHIQHLHIHTGLCIHHQKFSHISHSALTLDYAWTTNRIQPHFTFSTNTLDYECIINNSATLQIQHQHTLDYECIAHRIYPHFTFSTNPVDYECITNNSATLHVQHLHWIMHGPPTEFSHTSHSALMHSTLWMYHLQPHFILFVLISFGCFQSVKYHVGYNQNRHLIRYCHFLIAAAHYQIYCITALNLKLWQQCCWRFTSSQTRGCVTRWAVTSISKDQNAFLVMVTQSKKNPSHTA